VHYAVELGYVKLQSLVQQFITPCLLYMPMGRSVVMNLQPIRSQIQYLLYGTVAALHYKLVYYLQDKLEISCKLAWAQAAAVTLVRAVVVKRIVVQWLRQLQRLLHYYKLYNFDYGRQNGRVLV
jgi:hypothetical protein